MNEKQRAIVLAETRLRISISLARAWDEELIPPDVEADYDAYTAAGGQQALIDIVEDEKSAAPKARE